MTFSAEIVMRKIFVETVRIFQKNLGKFGGVL